MKISSLFSGCGGLDLGFKQAGFDIQYANDIDKDVWETYEKNLGHKIDRRSLNDIPSDEIPDCDGLIGGPPCQSWSLAGAMRGINDSRGMLFNEYIRVIRDKYPKFFVAENVPGILSSTHIGEYEKIIESMSEIGYDVHYGIYDARNYGVPQERKRVIVVGFRKDLGFGYSLPPHTNVKGGPVMVGGMRLESWVTLKEAIADLPEAVPALEKNKANPDVKFPNHEYMIGRFSTIYMSRNRRKNWDNQSFTIQAGGRHAPLHPSSCSMKKVGEDEWIFTGDNYRRLTVREAARIQTFPDGFRFYYSNVGQGYKMVGNAVPVKLSFAIASQILHLMHSTDVMVHEDQALGMK